MTTLTMRKASSESTSFCNLPPKNFPQEYFLAADRGDVYLIKGHKNLKSLLIMFASHSKVVHSEDHFSEGGLFRSRFSKSSFKFKRKRKVRVPSHASVSKYYADKTYTDLWFILLQVTKGFRFQKNKMYVSIFLATFHLTDLRGK